jgi:4,5-dihydroxyphthalate decarboxylase
MLELTVAFSRNPRLLPLIDGTVKPQNLKLNFVESHPAELFYRNLKFDEFDVSEMSISDYLMSREKRDTGRWQWAALPIFFLKAFYLWPAMYVNAESGIRNAADLKGKRVGVPDYQMTAALWIRVVLKELYGIQPNDITWYNGRTKEVSHGAMLGLYKDPPPGITLNWLDDSQTFDRMLDEGKIDAATGFYPRRSGPGQNFIDIDRYGGTRMEENPRIQKLLSDGGREIIVKYYSKVGVIPVNHMVIVQERILAQHPWVALEIYKAFRRSKEVAFERARELGAGYLLFADHSFQEQAKIFGDDPYPQGLQANRKMLEVLFRGSLEQGLTKNLACPEDVFYRTTLDT